MRLRVHALLTFVAVLLAGCGELPTAPININRAELMPEAMRIYSERFGAHTGDRVIE